MARLSKSLIMMGQLSSRTYYKSGAKIGRKNSFVEYRLVAGKKTPLTGRKKVVESNKVKDQSSDENQH